MRKFLLALAPLFIASVIVAATNIPWVPRRQVGEQNSPDVPSQGVPTPRNEDVGRGPPSGAEPYLIFKEEPDPGHPGSKIYPIQKAVPPLGNPYKAGDAPREVPKPDGAN